MLEMKGKQLTHSMTLTFNELELLMYCVYYERNDFLLNTSILFLPLSGFAQEIKYVKGNHDF